MKLTSILWAFSLCLLLVGCSKAPQEYISGGNQKFAAKQYEEAALLYKKALQIDPNNAEGHFRIGMIALQKQDADAAIESFLAATRLDPRHSLAWEQLGDLAMSVYLLDARRPAHMIAILQKCVDGLRGSDPNGPAASRLGGHLALLGGKNKEAIPLFEQAWKLRPEEATIGVALGQALIADGRVLEGRQTLAKAAALPGETNPAFEVLYSHYEGLDMWVEAEQVLKQRVEANPSRAEFALALANFYDARKRESEAAKIREAVLEDRNRYPQGLLAAGDFEARLGNLDRALEYYSRGAKAGGTQQTTCQKREAGTLAALGRIEEARSLLETLTAQDPSNRELRATRAFLAIAAGGPKDASAAATELRKLIEEKDDISANRYHLGRALSILGDQTGAGREWLRAVQLDPDDARPRLALARAALEEGEAESALRQLDGVLEIAPGAYEAELMRLSALAALGQIDRWRIESRLLKQKYPNNFRLELEEGSGLLQLGKTQEAIAKLKSIYKPGLPDPRLLLTYSQALIASGSKEEAIQLLETDLKALPGRETVMVELARGLAATGQSERATALLRQVLQQNPASVLGALHLSMLESTAGKLDAAIGILRSTLQAAGEHQTLLLTLAEMEFAAKRYPEAEKNFRAALKQNESSRRAQIGLSLLLAERGEKLEEAERIVADLHNKKQADIAAQDALGAVQLKRGNTQGALANSSAAARANPREALFRYHLGQALAVSGDKPSAKKEFEAALALQPQAFLAERIRASM